MPFASIDRWTECPECGSGLEFDGYRENELVCQGVECDWSENDGVERFTELMSCPDCGSRRVSTKGSGKGYREDKVCCEACGLVEGEIY